MGSSSKKALTAAREAFVLDLSRQGYGQIRITQELAKEENAALWHKGHAISQQAVCKIIQRVNERLRAQAVNDAYQIKLDHTERLLRAIEDLRDAYKASTQAQVMQKRKNGAGAKGAAFQQTEIGQKTQVGDHSILREIREHYADIRKIWGADAPMKTESLVRGAMHVSNNDLTKLDDHELETLRSLQEKISAPASAAGGGTDMGTD